MPEARQISGQPRPDKDTPAGTYAVRLTYNNLKPENGKMVDSNPPVDGNPPPGSVPPPNDTGTTPPGGTDTYTPPS